MMMWTPLAALLTVVQAATLNVQFVGNAGFELSDGATTIVTDLPYRSGASGYMKYEFADLHPRGRVIAVITHAHADHFDRELFLQRNWEIIAPEEVTRGLPAERVLDAAGGITVGRFHIEPVATPHGRTEHYSYRISWSGWRLYFTGDTEDPSDLLRMSDLDVAFVTPWLLCEIARRGAKVPARRVILHHQFPYRDSPHCLDPEVLEQGEGFSLRARR